MLLGGSGGIMSWLAPLGLAAVAGVVTWIVSGGGNPIEAVSNVFNGGSNKSEGISKDIKPLTPADEVKVDDGRGGEHTYVTKGYIDVARNGKTYRLKGIVKDDTFNITEVGVSDQPPDKATFEFKKGLK